MTNEHVHVPHVPEKDIRIIFDISILLKGANAFLQIVLGTILLFTGFTDKITSFVLAVAQNELVEDSSDFVASHVVGFLTSLSSESQFFAAWYLLSHGIIKIFLVWGLLKNKLWAYPASLAVFTLFIVYQIIRYTSTHSMFLVFLTIFDVAVIWLIWHEYRYLLKKKHIPLE